MDQSLLDLFHILNNKLSVVLSNCEILTDKIKIGSPEYEMINRIYRSGKIMADEIKKYISSSNHE